MKRSTWFMLGGLASAASTANAIRPAARTGPLSVPSFAFGLTPSELPVQAGMFEATTGLLFARKGGVQGWRGAVGLAADGASLAGLAWMHKPAFDSGAVLEHALVDELGADYRNRIHE